MSIEDFQVVDKISIDTSIIKRDCTKIHHQQGANLNYSDQIVENISGEYKNHHQNGYAYVQYDITVSRDDNANFVDASVIRLTMHLPNVFEKLLFH